MKFRVGQLIKLKEEYIELSRTNPFEEIFYLIKRGINSSVSGYKRPTFRTFIVNEFKVLEIIDNDYLCVCYEDHRHNIITNLLLKTAFESLDTSKYFLNLL